MPYIEQPDRQGRIADVIVRLGLQNDFKVLVDAWVSDLVDKQSDLLGLDGAALHQAIGGAKELKRILEVIGGAGDVSKRIRAMTAEQAQQGREPFIQTQGRMSDQA